MSGIASSAAGTALSIAALVVFLSWVLLFVLLLALYAAVILARKRRRPALTPGGARLGEGQARGLLTPVRGLGQGVPPAGLDELRQADPGFDEQLLLDAAQTATLLIFVASATGDEKPISRVVTESYWRTPLARIMQTTARDRRASDDFGARNPRASRARQQNVAVDYQSSAPELIAVRLGSAQEVCVRVAFGQLAAIVRPGAAAFAAGAAATSLTSGFASIGRSVLAQSAEDKQPTVSWVGTEGHYDLTFVRPAGALTDPAAALADRTCPTCGVTYRSELATACEHCGATRPRPWGQWLLASAVPAA